LHNHSRAQTEALLEITNKAGEGGTETMEKVEDANRKRHQREDK